MQPMYLNGAFGVHLADRTQQAGTKGQLQTLDFVVC